MGSNVRIDKGWLLNDVLRYCALPGRAARIFGVAEGHQHGADILGGQLHHRTAGRELQAFGFAQVLPEVGEHGAADMAVGVEGIGVGI